MTRPKTQSKIEQSPQFVKIVKLDWQVATEATKVIAGYVDGEVNTAKMRQELYLKALQLGDQSLTSTLELWEEHPEKITSKQLRDFFKMYSEMEKVRQTDQVIDLKKQEQEYEQKFKPAGMYANLWLDIFRWATSGEITYEDIELLKQAENSIAARIDERRAIRLVPSETDFQNQPQLG